MQTIVRGIVISGLLGILLSLAVPTDGFFSCKQNYVLCAVIADCAPCTQDAVIYVCPDYTDIIPGKCCTCIH
jgi:hypothetical protein